MKNLQYSEYDLLKVLETYSMSIFVDADTTNLASHSSALTTKIVKVLISTPNHEKPVTNVGILIKYIDETRSRRYVGNYSFIWNRY